MSKGHKPGGGIQSKQKREVGNRTGAPRERIRSTGVAQYGQAQGNHFTEPGRDGRMHSGYGGVKAHTGKPGYPSELGNKVALNVGGGGPGTGRTVYASGSQCRTGAADPGNAPKAPALFPGWERK